LKIWEPTKEELNNYLAKKNIKINYNCSLLEVLSDYDGWQQDFHLDFVPSHANNACVF
jgi:hypothetical protein